MKNIEIEIQVKIENSQPLLEFLKNNAEFQSEKHQVDEYFSPSHRDFLAIRPVKEWLRLRNANNKYFITYKSWHFNENGKSTHCDEYETEVSDIDQLEKIFKVLNLKSIAIVDKLRKIWIYKDYEISVDLVKGLGDFVEIEYCGKDEKIKPEEFAEEAINFLKNLQVGKIKRNYVGYPFMLLFKDEIKHEIQ